MWLLALAALLTTVAILLLPACSGPDIPIGTQLQLLKTVQLPIREPSGLSLSTNPDELWVVSDHEQIVYRIDLAGNVLDQVQSSGKDFEGIAVQPDNQSLWVVDEKEKSLIHLDSNHVEQARHVLDFKQNETKHGLEGLTFLPEQQHLMAVVEKSPGSLLNISMSGDVLHTYPLNFAKDYSGIFFEAHEHVLYILSDESQQMIKCTLEGRPLEVFRLGINKPEGIAIDIEKGHCYIVSDKTEELYIFQL